MKLQIIFENNFEILMNNEPTNIENKMFKIFVALKSRTSILKGPRKPFGYIKVYVGTTYKPAVERFTLRYHSCFKTLKRSY